MSHPSTSNQSSAVAHIAPEQRMLDLARGQLAAQAVHVFASLGVADLLQEGPKSAEEVAAATGAQAGALHRVLRFLTAVDVVVEQADGRFSLTPLGRTLRKRSLSVVRDVTMLMGSRFYAGTVNDLLHMVRTGENAFEHVHGIPFFGHLADHPEDAAAFNACMRSATALGAAAVLAAYDFSRFATIVDVGGGRGAFLTQVLVRNPAARGVLFDAAKELHDLALPATVADRCTRVSGSFFEAVPRGGDLYMLQQILHDWDDAKAVSILRRCREAMTPSARLVLIELAEPEPGASRTDWANADLLMMLLLDGRERTESELSGILAAAGFRLERVVRTRSPFWAIEAVPV